MLALTWCGQAGGGAGCRVTGKGVASLLPALLSSISVNTRREFSPALQGRMRRLLADLGDPQQAWPAAHVAGTKGKGSTAAMLAAILKAAGYKAGLYTRQGQRCRGDVPAEHSSCRGLQFRSWHACPRYRASTTGTQPSPASLCLQPPHLLLPRAHRGGGRPHPAR